MFSSLAVKLQSLWKTVKPKRNLGVVGLIVLVGFAFTFWALTASPAHAAFGVGDMIDALVGWVGYLVWALAALFIKLSIFVLEFMIELAGYNGYLDSPAVNIGWIMVRDVTNMFFVLIMLVIAFGTILGVEQYEWKKMLVKLILAAVLVNFSRTLCGVLIDVAQVIMVTFVNGVAATAGGNLVQAFGLTEVLQMSGSVKPEDITGVQVAVTGIAAMFFTMIMLAMMVGYLLILVLRVVTLWTLIVLSPLAFLTSILPQTQKYYAEWWSEFSNHVIVGPVVIFFIWLAFITVGGGDIHQNISDNTLNSARMSTTQDDGTVRSSGLGKALEWPLVANFIIALGMLMTGLKYTQRLGVAGAGALQKAVDTGKRFAMVASGVTAGIWAAKKTGEGAGKAGMWALNRMPLGPEYWKDKGATIKGVVGGKWWNYQRRQADKYATIGKEAYEYDKETGKIKVKDWGKWLRMQTLAPEVYRKKLAEDAADIAKEQEIRAKIASSTGGTPIGDKKLEVSQRSEIDKWMAESKKEQKQSTEMRGLMLRADVADLTETLAKEKDPARRADIQKSIAEKKAEFESKIVSGHTFGDITEEDKFFAARRAVFATASVKGALAKQLVEEQKRAVVAETKETWADKSTPQRIAAVQAQAKLAEDKVLARKELEELHAIEQAVKSEQGKKKWEATAGTKAELEYSRRRFEQEMEIDVAKSKDDYLKQIGEKPRFEATVRAAHAKELEDQLQNLTYDEKKARLGLILQDFQASQGTDKRAAAQLAATIAFNAKQGTELFSDAFESAAEKVFDEVVKTGDVDAHQRKVLSVLLGKHVKQGETTSAFTDFTKLHGPGQANIILRNLDESFKRTAGDYGSNYGGLFAVNIDGQTGQSVYSLQSNKAAVDGARKYWSGSIQPGRVQSLKHLVSNQFGKVVDSAQLIDDESIDNFVNIFRNVTKGTRIDSRLVNEWKTLNDDVKKKLLSELDKENKESRKILEQKFAGIVTKIEDESDEEPEEPPK